MWFASANLLATAAISPFVGALSDLMGRRYVAIIGSIAIILGQIICGTARGMSLFIGECAQILVLDSTKKGGANIGSSPAGMALAGVGTGINELTALAGTAELVPLSRRGYYIAGMTLTIFPFLPSAMFAQLISFHATWRFIAVLTSVWAFVGLALTTLFYFPPPRPDQQARGGKAGLLMRTDLVGGILSVVGVSCFEAGLLGAGYQVCLLPPSDSGDGMGI